MTLAKRRILRLQAFRLCDYRPALSVLDPPQKLAVRRHPVRLSVQQMKNPENSGSSSLQNRPADSVDRPAACARSPEASTSKFSAVWLSMLIAEQPYLRLQHRASIHVARWRS